MLTTTRTFPRCLPHRNFLAAALLALLLPACAALDDDDGPESSKAAAAARQDAKAAKQARAIEAARRKLAQARLEATADEKKQAAAVEQAARELALADHALEDFVVKSFPLRVRKAELDLKESEDSLAENLEEFEQLKLMYAEQDLADRTREMVIHRTERRIEQSRQELALDRAELDHLKEDELATERAKLELEVNEKRQAQEAAQIDARVSASGKAIAVLEAQHALADAEADAQQTKDAAADPGEEEDDGDED